MSGHIKPGTSRSAAIARRHTFVEEYIANKRNGTAAALAAGYSPKTAHTQACMLLADPRIKDLIEARSAELAEKHELTTDAVIAELSKMVHVDPRKMFGPDNKMLPPHEWPDGIASAVASFEVVEEVDPDGESMRVVALTKKVKFWDKNAAIDKAMKHLGLFEKDNSQKNGALSDLPREMVKAIIDRLKQMNQGNDRTK